MRGVTGTGSRRVRTVEAEKAPGRCGLAEAVARYLFKLMAYKDEYEVARLYSETSFLDRVKSTFDGEKLRFEFHLAPPLLARRNPVTGEPKKMSFGPWMLKVFAALAKLKFLRGTGSILSATRPSGRPNGVSSRSMKRCWTNSSRG